MKINIYCLYEPHTCKIRYIGRTKNKLSKRLATHICKAKKHNLNSHKENWIRSLLKNGIKPKIKLLVELDVTWTESHVIEKNLIQKHLLKHSLVNGDDRGPGHISGKIIDSLTEENRVKKIKKFFQKEENKTNFYNKIYCYSLDGKYLREYKSTKFASVKLGIPSAQIANHMEKSKKNNVNPIKNLYFRRHKSDKIEVSDRYSSIYIKVRVTCRKTEETDIYESMQAFAKAFKLGSWDLHQYRNGIRTKRFNDIEKTYKISSLYW